MKANPNIDELLCSFLDGELPPRQQTEVQRLVARDPEVGRRLRQLQGCKTLIGALPRAQAPVEMLERIRLSLERKSLLDEPAMVSSSSAGARRLMARRLLAAAAMIAVLGVLGAVVYQIVAPVPGAGIQPPMAQLGVPSTGGFETSPGPVTMVADSGLSERLEIRTASLAQADALVARVIKESGLSASIDADIAGNTMIYRLAGTRDSVSRLFADLGRGWQHLGSTTLHVEGLEPGASSITVEAVTVEQAMGVVAQKSTQASLETAQNYAILNNMAANTPGREVLAMISDDTALARDLLAIDDIARLAGPGKDITPASPHGESNVSLTIILLRTR